MFLWQLPTASEEDVEGEETQQTEETATEGACSSAADVCVETQETPASAKKKNHQCTPRRRTHTLPHSVP